MNNEVGVLFGKFLPLHNGHINMILEAYTMVDKLYVVLCHSSRDDDRTPGIQPMSKELRLKWLHHTFKDFDKLEIVDVCEEDIAEYPNGWKDFVQLLKQAVPEEFHVVFTSEYQYDEPLKTLLPGIRHHLIDPTRRFISVSATDIRQDPFKYWGHIPKIVRPTFVKKVAIVGTESCGKTTLSKILAQYYNTTYVEEYGRQYVLDHLGSHEELLQSDDYLQIAMRHKQNAHLAAMEANRILIVDTEATVTQFYCKKYTGKTHPVITSLMAAQQYDYWLFLSPTVLWVPDGLRNTSDQNARYHDRNELFKLLESHPTTTSYDRFGLIEGESFHERFKLAVSLIDKHLYL